VENVADRLKRINICHVPQQEATYQEERRCAAHPCFASGAQYPDPACRNVANATAALPYAITDGDGHVVIDIAEFPTQRQVDSTLGQLFSAGGLPGVLLTGSTLTTRGSQVRYRFAEDGRYLVIGINLFMPSMTGCSAS